MATHYHTRTHLLAAAGFQGAVSYWNELTINPRGEDTKEHCSTQDQTTAHHSYLLFEH